MDAVRDAAATTRYAKGTHRTLQGDKNLEGGGSSPPCIPVGSPASGFTVGLPILA